MQSFRCKYLLYRTNTHECSNSLIAADLAVDSAVGLAVDLVEEDSVVEDSVVDLAVHSAVDLVDKPARGP